MSMQSHHGVGIVLRPGEMFLKGKNRHVFEQRMEANIKRAVSHRTDVRVERRHGRFFVLGADDQDLLDRLGQVFGISSISPAIFCDKDLDAITATALELAQKRDLSARKFRISTRRTDKRFAHRSYDVDRHVGAEVAVETALEVDLEEYDLNIGIEIASEWTFLWARRIQGAGGLPVGSSGTALLLLSGGIDSPVAGHLMQKRGISLDAVYFHAFPYTSDAAKDKVIQLARVLSRQQKRFNLHVVPFTEVQEMMRDTVDPRFLVIFYRRAMIRIAEMIAAKIGHPALVTGESLGQVASQTVPNMAAIEDAATVPILRPLVAFDKSEIIDIARKIGTFDISVLPHDDCCSLFVPKHPETKAKLAVVQKMEVEVEWRPAVEAVFSHTETISL